MRSILVLSILASSCAAAPAYMRPAAGPAPSCPGEATIVFVRPSATGRVIEVRDADGTFLGRLDNRSSFRTAASPGEHFFVALVVDRKEARPVGLRAELEAGKTYFVDVETSQGLPLLYAVAPRLSYWGRLDGWLARTRGLERDAAQAAPAPDDWTSTYSYAFYGYDWWKGPDPRRAEHALVASDGIGDVGAPAPAAQACSEKPDRPTLPAALALAVLPANDPDLPRCIVDVLTGSHLRTLGCETENQDSKSRRDAWLLLNRPRYSGSW